LRSALCHYSASKTFNVFVASPPPDPQRRFTLFNQFFVSFSRMRSQVFSESASPIGARLFLLSICKFFGRPLHRISNTKPVGRDFSWTRISPQRSHPFFFPHGSLLHCLCSSTPVYHSPYSAHPLVSFLLFLHPAPEFFPFFFSAPSRLPQCRAGFPTACPQIQIGPPCSPPPRFSLLSEQVLSPPDFAWRLSVSSLSPAVL